MSDSGCTPVSGALLPRISLVEPAPVRRSSRSHCVLTSETAETGATSNCEVHLTLTKEFTDDPVVAGATANLRFTITNTTALAVTNMAFTDNLNDALSGLTAGAVTPDPPCGAGSSLTGSLTFGGGNAAVRMLMALLFISS